MAGGSATLKAFFAPKKSKAAPKRASEESTSSTEAKDVAAPAAKKSKPEPAEPAGRLRRPDRAASEASDDDELMAAAPAAAKAAPAEAPAAPAAAKPAEETAKPKEKQAPVFANPGAKASPAAPDWADAGCVPYAAIAAVFEKIEATTKRLEIQGHVRDLLGQVMRHAPGDLTACVFLPVSYTHLTLPTKA